MAPAGRHREKLKRRGEGAKGPAEIPGSKGNQAVYPARYESPANVTKLGRKARAPAGPQVSGITGAESS